MFRPVEKDGVYLNPMDIAFATKQNWANPASILDGDGDRGDVLWLETPPALQAGWGKGASEVLRREGRTVLHPVLLLAAAGRAPSELAACLRPHVTQG